MTEDTRTKGVSDADIVTDLPAPPRLADYTRLPLLIIAAMVVAAAILYPSLPERFPTHWGISGAPDAWSSKSFGSVFFMPMMALGVYALLVLAPYLDPKRRSLKVTFHAYNLIIDAVIAMQAVIFAATMIAAFDARFDVVKVVLVAVGALFIVVGKLMSTVRQNWTFGVRVSWTLADEEVWRRTNLLAGRLFVVVGLVTAASALLPAPTALVTMFVALGIVLVVTYGYSYLLFRKRHPEA